MTGFVLRTGDLLEVTMPGPAVVPVLLAPLPLTGSSTKVTVAGLPLCLQGDELPMALREPLPYTQPPFTVPGTGTLTLTLLPENLTQQTTSGGKPILLGGGAFPAVFTVETPATQPTPAGPVPDPELAKAGTARFVTTNTSVTAG
jgi:Contractile injection system spike tip protein